MSIHVLVPLNGVSDLPISAGEVLSLRTRNFYPDDQEYLVNYPGKTDYFLRETPQSNTRGTPPSLSLGTYSRIIIFRDIFSNEHIVFVVGYKLYEVVGNSCRELYTFRGYTINSVAYPQMFVHKNRLIICNQGDPVMQWDGYQDVTPLGVTEIPAPPTVIVHEDPFIRYRADMSGANPLLPNATYFPDGHWNFRGLWPPGSPPENNLGNQVVDTERIPGFYSWCVVFYDRDGNQGRPSIASPVVFVGKDEENTVMSPGVYAIKNWATVEWVNPIENEHIHFVGIGRTTNLHELKGGDQSLFYRDWFQSNITQQRYTARRSDADIANDTLIDFGISPPPSSKYGFSWGARIGVVSENTIYFSDENKNGQFRLTSNFYKPKGEFQSALPIGDRLMIITDKTCEILYTDNNGNVLHLETYENKGSYYSGSFAVYRDVAFGYFNDGFYMFDGSRFEEVDTPYFLKPEYVSKSDPTTKAVITGEWYFFSTMYLNKSKVILMFHLPTKRWYIIDENINDIVVAEDCILGVKDSIYVLYNGNSYPVATLHLKGIVPKNSTLYQERGIAQIGLVLDPRSCATLSIQVSNEDEFSYEVGVGRTYPSSTRLFKADNYKQYFNKTGAVFGEDVKWVSPNEVMLVSELTEHVGGVKHSLLFSFEVGKPQRIRAVYIDFTDGEDKAMSE